MGSPVDMAVVVVGVTTIVFLLEVLLFRSRAPRASLKRDSKGRFTK